MSKSDVGEPSNWFWGHLHKNREHLKAAPIAFLLVFALGFAAAWFIAWQVVVASKDASIQRLDISNRENQSMIDRLQKDNERLSKENLDFKSTLADRETPLKKRTKILASQLAEFSKTSEADISGGMILWEDRFRPRLAKLTDELDEHGQHSDPISMISHQGLPLSSNSLDTIAKELERMANKLKE